MVRSTRGFGLGCGGVFCEPLWLEFDVGRVECRGAGGGDTAVGGPSDGCEVCGGSVGVGVRAKEEEESGGVVRKEEIVRCLKEVMEKGERREEIRRNVRKWRSLAREAVSQGGSSDRNVCEFVNWL